VGTKRNTLALAGGIPCLWQSQLGGLIPVIRSAVTRATYSTGVVLPLRAVLRSHHWGESLPLDSWHRAMHVKNQQVLSRTIMRRHLCNRGDFRDIPLGLWTGRLRTMGHGLFVSSNYWI
jgi:hypothetical protein